MKPGCIDVRFEMLNADANLLQTEGCVRFEIEVMGNTPILFDNTAPIWPSDGKVCFPAIGERPYCRNFPITYNTDGISSPDRRVRVTKYYITPC
jgi:hypothetical protein